MKCIRCHKDKDDLEFDGTKSNATPEEIMKVADYMEEFFNG
jgi:hypothetical protein